MQDDTTDLLLMKTNPVELLIKYQRVFNMITKKYARCGYYPLSDCDDIMQHINEMLLCKMDKIQRQYDGRVLVRTYLSVICKNTILEYLRKSRRRDPLRNRREIVREPHCLQWQNSTIFIIDEFQRFEKVMYMIGSTKYKLLLLMKLIYRIRVDINDFRQYHPGTMPFVTTGHLDLFNNSATMKDKDIYLLLLPIMQQAGALINRPDTIRRWFNNKTEEVIKLMNGNPVRSCYSPDTLQILVEKYYAMVEAGTYTPIRRI